MSDSNPFQSPSPTEGLDPIVLVKGIVGAAIGAAIGYFAFVKLSSINLYAFMLPGALIGLGCGFMAKKNSNLLSGFCFLLAIVVSVLGEWNTLWFSEDESLGYFVQHIHESRGGFALFAVILNGVIGAWLCRRG
jgi:uncharacterized membrane protein YeaQ/YmgE (transglycosylase-associated protein family)